MTDEAVVLSLYPNAKAQRREPMRQLGERANPAQPSSWSIFDQPGLGAMKIGSGTTKAEAWADAARLLKTDSAEAEVEAGRENEA